MSAPLDGKVDILSAPPPTGQATITLDGTAGDILAGGNGQAGAAVVRNGDGKVIVRLTSAALFRPQLGTVASGGIALYNTSGQATVSLTTAGDVAIGGSDVDGDLVLKSKDGQTVVAIRAAGSGQGISIRDASGKEIVSLHADAPENIHVRDHTGKTVLNFVGSAFDNKAAALWIGTHTADGGKKAALVVLRGRNGNDAIVLNGGEGENLFIRDAANKPVFNFAGDAFDGKIAGLWLGAAKGDGGKKPGLIVLRDNEGTDSIVVDGAQGDIVFNNADCAEEFDVTEVAGVEPGVVMVIDDDGRLRPSYREYDRKVAGVVAGASGCRPAIVLGRHASRSNRYPIALNGRTYCRVDASYNAIDVGDLLTTSPTPGHAMKANDPARAFGAVIGKALRPLRKESDLIPILVSLQ